MCLWQGFIRIYLILGIYLRRKNTFLAAALTFYGTSIPNWLLITCYKTTVNLITKAAVHGVSKSQTWLSDFTFTFHFQTLEKEMATHSSVLAWRIPGTGSHRVGNDWSDLTAVAAVPVFPGGSDGKESDRNAWDQGSIPESGRSPGEEMATHSSILAWRMSREAWWATVHGVAKSWTWLSD